MAGDSSSDEVNCWLLPACYCPQAEIQELKASLEAQRKEGEGAEAELAAVKERVAQHKDAGGWFD